MCAVQLLLYTKLFSFVSHFCTVLLPGCGGDDMMITRCPLEGRESWAAKDVGSRQETHVNLPPCSFIYPLCSQFISLKTAPIVFTHHTPDLLCLVVCVHVILFYIVIALCTLASSFLQDDVFEFPAMFFAVTPRVSSFDVGRPSMHRGVASRSLIFEACLFESGALN